MHFCLPDPFYHRISIQRGAALKERTKQFLCALRSFSPPSQRGCEMAQWSCSITATSTISTCKMERALHWNSRTYRGCVCLPGGTWGCRTHGCVWARFEEMWLHLGNIPHHLLPQFPHLWDSYNRSRGTGQWYQEPKVAWQIKALLPGKEKPLRCFVCSFLRLLLVPTTHVLRWGHTALGLAGSWVRTDKQIKNLSYLKDKLNKKKILKGKEGKKQLSILSYTLPI